MAREGRRTIGARSRWWVRGLGFGLLLLLAGAGPEVARAQNVGTQFFPATKVIPNLAAPIVDFTLTERPFCPVEPRRGGATVYDFPGSPMPALTGAPGAPLSLGASFAVGQVCQPNPPFGGVFLAGGQGLGDLVAVTPGWPFGPPPFFRLCDPDADETFWFAYGNSLNAFTPGTTREDGINFPHNNFPTCDFQATPVEGMWFIGRRSVERQFSPDGACLLTDVRFPNLVGNALFCELFGPWVTPGSNPPTLNPSVLNLGFKSCNFYQVCSAAPVGGQIARGFCGNPAGPLPVGLLVGNGQVGCNSSNGGNGATVAVRVNNALTGQPISGATVTGEGLSAQVTGGNGTVTFTDVPTGVPITFTATATDFADGTDTRTLAEGDSVVLPIPLTPPVPGAVVILQWGENPRDLDAHLEGPDGAGGTFHVYYGNRVPDPPVGADLNHDDQNGNGFETITVFEGHAGTYLYYVHHYAGTGTICSSGASVRVTLGSEQLTPFSPPGGCTGVGDTWYVFSWDGVTLKTGGINQLPSGPVTHPLASVGGAIDMSRLPRKK